MKYLLLIIITYLSAFPQNINIIKKDIKKLTSPEFYGRGFLNEGHLIAANYIQQRFAQVGLQPPPNYNSYFQDFITTIYLIKNSTLCINNNCLEIGKDFIPHYASANNCNIQGKYIFLKTGTPNYYKKNVKNKIIIIDNTTKNIPEKFQEYFDISQRIKLAIENGAKAIIILEKKPIHAILGNKLVNTYPIPILKVFKDSIKIKKKGKINLCVSASWEVKETQNVVGFKKGKTDTVIIIGAHYDHLGIIYDKTQNDSAIFPGANDNASGIALLIALADTLAKIETKYSYLFIAFGGEEAGLLGSFHYVNNPIIPLTKTKLMLNLDLWGFGEKGFVVVAGLDFPHIYEKLKNITTELYGTNYSISPRKNAPNSDHYYFTKMGVPSVFLYNKGGNFYHDVWDNFQSLTLKGIPKIYKILLKFLHNIEQE